MITIMETFLWRRRSINRQFQWKTNTATREATLSKLEALGRFRSKYGQEKDPYYSPPAFASKPMIKIYDACFRAVRNML